MHIVGVDTLTHAWVYDAITAMMIGEEYAVRGSREVIDH